LGARLGVWLRHTAAERELRRLAQRERAVANALRASLLPPQLPSVSGVALAAHFRPGGDVVVGGDFYDVFTFESPLAPSMGIAIPSSSGTMAPSRRLTAAAPYWAWSPTASGATSASPLARASASSSTPTASPRPAAPAASSSASSGWSPSCAR